MSCNDLLVKPTVTNSSGTGTQPSISLLCDIMMYKNKDSSSMLPIKWGLKHEATVMLAYLKMFEETHRAVEVVRPGLLTQTIPLYKGIT